MEIGMKEKKLMIELIIKKIQRKEGLMAFFIIRGCIRKGKMRTKTSKLIKEIKDLLDRGKTKGQIGEILARQKLIRDRRQFFRLWEKSR